MKKASRSQDGFECSRCHYFSDSAERIQRCENAHTWADQYSPGQAVTWVPNGIDVRGGSGVVIRVDQTRWRPEILCEHLSGGSYDEAREWVPAQDVFPRA